MVFLRSISVPCPYHPHTCTFQKLIVLLRTLNCIHMGKGLGLIGNFRGRVGNVIGYELKNSRDKVTQGLRQWQPYVKNPQTLPQIRQRAKLQNINNVYRALEPIISRGFESVEYGDKSRNYFMKLALTSESVPFTEKDSKIAVPANYIISEGGLPTIECTQVFGTNGWIVTNIINNERQLENIKTIGQFWQSILNNNTYLKNGQELTFIVISKKNGQFQYYVESEIINTEDETNMDEIWPERDTKAILGTIRISRLYPYLAFNSIYNTIYSPAIGGAIIISEPLGKQRKRRSTTRIWCDESHISEYYTESAMQRAYVSYMKQSWNRDWQEQPMNK